MLYRMRFLCILKYGHTIATSVNTVAYSNYLAEKKQLLKERSLVLTSMSMRERNRQKRGRGVFLKNKNPHLLYTSVVHHLFSHSM